VGEHVEELLVEGVGVLLGVEVAGLLAPEGPGVGQAVEDLAGVGLGPGFLRASDAAPPEAARPRWSAGRKALKASTLSAGTPALRKYFCAMMSAAIWLQVEGTTKPSIWKTARPSGFRISLFRSSQRMPS